MSRRFLALCCLTFFLCAAPAAAVAGAWFEPLVLLFEEAGYIDFSLSPQAAAARWKFLDLLLRLKGGIVHGPFAAQTFDDISTEDPHYFLFEEGAAQGWVRGVGNCAGEHPCFAYPGRAINRAEAAALIVRAFGVQSAQDAPEFTDVRPGSWYAEHLRAAASRCIFRGDDARRTVRPDAMLNQAEMLAALARAYQGLFYPACDAVIAALPPTPSALQIQLPLPVIVLSSSSASSASASAASSSAVSSQASTQTSPALSSSVSSVVSSASSPPMQSSSSLHASSVTSDPEYMQFLSRYNDYVASFSVSLSATQSSKDDTNLRVLNLLKAQMDMIAGYYQYVSIARQRPLSVGEKQVAESLRQAIEAAFRNILSIQRE